MSTFIQSFSGERWDLIEPDPKTIAISDIGQSLSKLCRFNGHCSSFYSVAEHSARLANLMPKHTAIFGLLHDAHEAWTGDLSPAVKRLMGTKYLSVTDPIDAAIRESVGLPRILPNGVGFMIKQYDRVMLATERRDLMVTANNLAWDLAGVKVSPLPIIPWSSDYAYRMWMQRYRYAMMQYREWRDAT